MSTASRIAADAIQRTYGDASQTALDHQAASAVVSDLRAAGWASPSEVAAIVAAAGGKVVLTDEHMRAMLNDRYELMVHEDGPTLNKVIQARERA